MKNFKALLILLTLGGISAADAQYYYGPPPPPPPPPGYRHQHEEREKTDEGQSQPSGYFGVSIGFSQPVGSFANEFGATNTNSTTYPYGTNYPTGYAQSGLNFNVSLGIPVNNSNLGIAVMYGSCTNPYDINAYTNNVAASDPGKGYDAGDVSDVYSTSFILAGLFATYPIQRLSLDFKLMGGVALCYLPEIAYSAEGPDPVVNNQTDNYSWDIASSSSTAFAFGVGADLRYKLRRTSIMIGVDFLSTDPMIRTQEQYTDPSGAYHYSNVSGNSPTSVVNTYIGLAYSIR